MDLLKEEKSVPLCTTVPLCYKYSLKIKKNVHLAKQLFELVVKHELKTSEFVDFSVYYTVLSQWINIEFDQTQLSAKVYTNVDQNKH